MSKGDKSVDDLLAMAEALEGKSPEDILAMA